MMNETSGIGGTLNDDSNGHSDEHDSDTGENVGSGQTGYTDPVLQKLDLVIDMLSHIADSLARIANYLQPKTEADIAMANAPAIVGTKSSAKKKAVSKTRGKVARKK